MNRNNSLNNKKGKVWLVGAGPGDASLITVKGREVLTFADVVVYDTLEDDSLLEAVPDGAELIHAIIDPEKRSDSQNQINNLLASKASEGRRVVRLEAGDPFIFGGGCEALKMLKRNGIDVEVVPGVSSAIAAPAYAGIPLTCGGLSNGVSVVSGHRQRGWEGLDFKALAGTGNTLVFLMGIPAARIIMDGLTGAGMAADTPAVIVENATIDSQRVLSSDLAHLEELAENCRPEARALIIVGRAAGLSESLEWYTDKDIRNY